MERLAKSISSRGYSSRRDAEKIIQEGRVKVNGVAVSEIVTFVEESDVIEIDNVILTISKPRLWIYYKPRGFVTTHKDPQGRPTVFDNLPIKIPHIISVGRLDIESEGLLLLTNSGELARKLELPSNNYSRTYKVKAYGKFNEESLKLIASGPEIDGVQYRPCKIKLTKSNISNHWFEITIYEGKNREIRRLFEHIGMEINRLIRVSYYKYILGTMQSGEILEVKVDF